MENEFVVSGIILDNEDEYKAALSDRKNIEYISAKVDLTNSRTLLKLYKSLIAKKTFKTIVGFVFLKQLYDIVSMSSEMEGEEIPLLQFDDFLKLNGENDKKNKKSKNAKEHDKQKTKAVDNNNNSSDMIGNLKNKIKIMGITIVLLIGCVIAMFIITMRSDTVTYNGAKDSVIDEYEEWSQQLDEREKAIEEKEKELGLNE